MSMRTMDGFRSVFKLKDDKAEFPDVYLGATLSQVETETGTKCWSIVIMALYVLKSSGAAFRVKLSGVIHDIGYTPSKADPDILLRQAVKTDGAEYYEMVL